MSEISRRILCVDDEPNILEGLRRQLKSGYDVLTAVGPEAGLRAVQQQGPFAVVIADHQMPVMTGSEFLREVRRVSPDTVTMMLTGCADLEVAVAALHEGRIFRFLNKPCSREVLKTAVEQALEQYRLVVAERELTAALGKANNELNQLNRELEDRVCERTAAIDRLYHFVSDLSGLDSLESVGNLVVRTVAEMLDSRRVSLMIPDLSGEYLSILAACGISSELKARIRVPKGAPIAGWAFAECRCIVVNDAEPASLPTTRYDSEFFAVVPLVSSVLLTSGCPVGVLNVTEPRSGAPYDEEALAKLKAVAESAAVAIQNQIRLHERNEARDAVILAMAKLAENRDPETGAHLERVQTYCRLLSRALAETPKYASQIDEEFVSAIVRSSPLHDIGKVGIPDAILLKPGRLTPDEFEIMKTHTTIGGDTIRGLLDQRPHQAFLRMGMEIAYGHHEKFDGSGYPKGWVGEQIPLPARILALADVYDALTSRRVYKAAMSHQEASVIIRDGRGKHFDPDIVDAFLRQESRFQQAAIDHSDESSSCVPGDLAARSATVSSMTTCLSAGG